MLAGRIGAHPPVRTSTDDQALRAPTPKALAALAAAMVRTLAEAQTELAAKVRNRR